MENLKKHKNSNLTLSVVLFVIAELVLFSLVFITSGLTNRIVSFLSILICFIYTLFYIQKNQIVIISQIALFTTVIADVFLVILDPQIKTIAMTSFLITQVCYFLRLLNYSNKKKPRLFICLILVAFMLTATCIVLKDKTDYLSIVSMMYYVLLTFNLICSLIHFKKSSLFAIGIILFLCCDTLIGLNVAINNYIYVDTSNILYLISHTSFNLPWVFYIPAQVLIALSIKDVKTP